MPSLRPAESLTITSIAGLKKAVEEARLNWFNHNISYANGIACALSKIEKFEAGLREKTPKVEYHDDLEHEWWSCSRCGLTGSEDEICGHIAGWDCARELRRILDGGVAE